MPNALNTKTSAHNARTVVSLSMVRYVCGQNARWFAFFRSRGLPPYGKGFVLTVVPKS